MLEFLKNLTREKALVDRQGSYVPITVHNVRGTCNVKEREAGNLTKETMPRGRENVRESERGDACSVGSEGSGKP